MPKLFVISDVHGAFDIMKKALDDAGFDANNPDHWLISCGDEWDRFDQPVEVMRFLSGLERKVIIKGNHMLLFEDLCLRGYPDFYDHSNGTLDTVKILGNYKSDYEFDLCCERAYNRTKKFRNSMVNYFETKSFVFCHSWVPVNVDDDLPAHYRRNRKFSKKECWRSASQFEWNQSMWMNPLEMVKSGFDIDKTIVCGHWHCSAGWAYEKGLSEFGDDACFDPYYYKDKLIMIDSCVAHTKKINVLVLEDEFLEDNNEDN